MAKKSSNTPLEESLENISKMLNNFEEQPNVKSNKIDDLLKQEDMKIFR